MTKRVAIYTRVSKDNLGDERLPTRQEADCRAFAAIRNWEVIAAFRDVDLSAYQPRVRRPAYEALLEAITEQEIEGVLVWKIDRLVRRSAEFERFWASCERVGVSLASVTEPIDTSNELGLAIVRILVTFAALESSTKSLRLKSAARAAALAGERHAGSRAYGYNLDRSAIVADEAAVIREGAERVLRGETLASIARDFHRREIRRAGGGVWTGQALRKILDHPSLAGLRAYEGEIVAKGSWPAILDEVTSARLRLLFADPTRWQLPKQPTPHLLRGLLRCGRCGGRLKAGHSPDMERTYYTCYPKPYGCAGILIFRQPVDELVASVALDRIAQIRREVIVTRRGVKAANVKLAQALERHRADLQRAAHDYYVAHVIDRAQFVAVRDDLERALGHERAVMFPLRVLLKRLGAQTPQAAWNSFDLAQRRETLGVLLDHVVIHPASPDRRRFHPERVTVFWLAQGSLGPSTTRAVAPPKRRRSPGERFTSKEAANYLDMTETRVLRLLRQSDLAGRKGKHGWKITQAAIDAFLEKRRLRPPLAERRDRSRPAPATPAGSAS